MMISFPLQMPVPLHADALSHPVPCLSSTVITPGVSMLLIPCTSQEVRKWRPIYTTSSMAKEHFADFPTQLPNLSLLT